MKRLLATTALTLCFAASALANGANNNCNGSNSCPQNTTTTNNTTNAPVANGGQGGNGGTGVGIGIGKGGNASAAAASNQTQVQVQDQQQDQAITWVNPRNPVSTATSAALTTSAACMGSSSIGGQGVGFGLSLGTTWTDDDCILGRKIERLKALGLPKAAVAMACTDEDTAAAIRASGDRCPGDPAPTPPAAPEPPLIGMSPVVPN